MQLSRGLWTVNSMRFILQPYVKSSTVKNAIDNLEKPQKRVFATIDETNNTSIMLQNVFNLIKQRVKKCLEVNVFDKKLKPFKFFF